MTKVCVPWPDLEKFAQQHGYDGWPYGCEVVTYSGETITDRQTNQKLGPWASTEQDIDQPPEQPRQIDYFVLPYARKTPYKLVPQLAESCKIQSLRAGVDELLPLVPDGCQVFNAQGVHDLCTAEHGLTLVLALTKQLPKWNRLQLQDSWSQSFIDSLQGKTVMIVGYGAIGQLLGQMLNPFQVQLIKVARTARPNSDVWGSGDLTTLLPQADVVVSILPGGNETEGIWDAHKLGLLKDGAKLINIGRGNAVNVDALLTETASGRITAAIDVAPLEPLPSDHPLWQADPENLLITPHVAGGSWGSHTEARKLVIEQIKRLAEGAELVNRVL